MFRYWFLATFWHVFLQLSGRFYLRWYKKAMFTFITDTLVPSHLQLSPGFCGFIGYSLNRNRQKVVGLLFSSRSHCTDSSVKCRLGYKEIIWERCFNALKWKTQTLPPPPPHLLFPISHLNIQVFGRIHHSFFWRGGVGSSTEFSFCFPRLLFLM